MSNFNGRFKQLYNEGGISQADTSTYIYNATGVKIPQTTLSGYLANKEPRLSVALAIAKAYDVSLEWLAGVVDGKTPLSIAVEDVHDVLFDPKVKTAAKQIAEMPDVEKQEIISYVAARYSQWRKIKNLVEVVRRFDTDGSLASRIADLSGIDAGRINSAGNLVSDKSFSNGDTHGINEDGTLAVS